MEKLLTIVIPTYNMEKYLHKCLCSLIIEDKSLFESLEVLVINDGSKDSSSLIGHEYERRYPDVFRVIDKENGNYGSCVNRGVKEAKGKYIKILDADDYSDKEALEQFLGKIKNVDADVVFSDLVTVDSSGKQIIYYSYSDLPHESIFETRQIPYNIVMWMHAVTYRTQMLRDINYHQTEGISYTDQEWIFLPLNAAKRAFYVQVCLYHYLTGREGQTIDSKVYAKNVGQEAKGLFVMLDEYKNLKDNEKNLDKYMFFRLKCRTKMVYQGSLIWGGYKYFDINRFDAELKTASITFYQETEQIIINLNRFVKNFKFIKKWRETKSTKKYQYTFKIIASKILSNIILIIKELTHFGRNKGVHVTNACKNIYF